MATAPSVRDPGVRQRAAQLTRGLGGRDNIESVDAVAITRLRVRVRDTTRIDEPALVAAGCPVMVVGTGLLHVIVGNEAEDCAAAIRENLPAAKN